MGLSIRLPRVRTEAHAKNDVKVTKDAESGCDGLELRTIEYHAATNEAEYLRRQRKWSCHSCLSLDKI